MIRGFISLLGLMGLMVPCAQAQEVAYALTPSPPPPLRVPGTLRIVGVTAMQDLLSRWRAEFGRQNPGLRFEIKLLGTDVGMAALYTGSADLVLAGRDSTPAEDKAFEWIYRYRPTRVEIATGSLDQAGKSPAVVLFVHNDNPLRSLTMQQLQAILLPAGQGAAAPIRRWGELGLTGEWQNAAIHVYSFDMESGTGRFLRQRALGDSRRLEWPIITEYSAAVGKPDDLVTRRIFKALAMDRFGLALAHVPPDKGGAPVVGRPLALAAADGLEPVSVSQAALIRRQYPLARPVYAYFNQPPGAAPAPEISAFLTFAASRSGQSLIDGEQGYLPLPGVAAKP
jgi:phosphate transport system substrate-binding protein